MSKRWRVVVSGSLIGSGISVFLGLVTMGKVGPVTSASDVLGSFLVCFGPLGGPLSEPLAYVDFSPRRMIVSAALLLSLIFLHPLRPGILTSWISGSAIAVWFLWGLAMTYYGV